MKMMLAEAAKMQEGLIIHSQIKLQKNFFLKLFFFFKFKYFIRTIGFPENAIYHCGCSVVESKKRVFSS